MEEGIASEEVASGNEFTFLNCSLTFPKKINWNFSSYGKLWNYHLNYFEYLLQPSMKRAEGIRLIHDFIESIDSLDSGLEPYPISLRAVNWIKFVASHRVRDPIIDASLFAQYRILVENLEYHLLGNHLLENAISLLFGSYYFKDPAFYDRACKILIGELKEQILDDGAHFELSPMYHRIVLHRLLDCYNLVTNNHTFLDALSECLRSSASRMLGWMQQLCFRGGEWPLMNDSVFGNTPATGQMIDYADRLGVQPESRSLVNGGYRKLAKGPAELVVDVGSIGPDYIPGHAHADTLNFEMALHGARIIVDTGTSTYEKNAERQRQRSTPAHNTVTIDGEDSSEVWGGFRVARRARPFGLAVSNKGWQSWIRCSHDGYRRLSGRPIHTRTWILQHDSLTIKDQISGTFTEAVARYHIHPDFAVEKTSKSSGYISSRIGSLTINWRTLKGRCRIVNSTYHPEFNLSIPNQCLEVYFEEPEAIVEFVWEA